MNYSKKSENSPGALTHSSQIFQSAVAGTGSYQFAKLSQISGNQNSNFIHSQIIKNQQDYSDIKESPEANVDNSESEIYDAQENQSNLNSPLKNGIIQKSSKQIIRSIELAEQKSQRSLLRQQMSLNPMQMTKFILDNQQQQNLNFQDLSTIQKQENSNFNYILNYQQIQDYQFQVQNQNENQDQYSDQNVDKSNILGNDQDDLIESAEENEIKEMNNSSYQDQMYFLQNFQVDNNYQTFCANQDANQNQVTSQNIYKDEISNYIDSQSIQSRSDLKHGPPPVSMHSQENKERPQRYPSSIYQNNNDSSNFIKNFNSHQTRITKQTEQQSQDYRHFQDFQEQEEEQEEEQADEQMSDYKDQNQIHNDQETEYYDSQLPINMNINSLRTYKSDNKIVQNLSSRVLFLQIMFKCVDMANFHIKEKIKLKTAFFKFKYNVMLRKIDERKDQVYQRQNVGTQCLKLQKNQLVQASTYLNSVSSQADFKMEMKSTQSQTEFIDSNPDLLVQKNNQEKDDIFLENQKDKNEISNIENNNQIKLSEKALEEHDQSQFNKYIFQYFDNLSNQLSQLKPSQNVDLQKINKIIEDAQIGISMIKDKKYCNLMSLHNSTQQKNKEKDLQFSQLKDLFEIENSVKNKIEGSLINIKYDHPQQIMLLDGSQQTAQFQNSKNQNNESILRSNLNRQSLKNENSANIINFSLHTDVINSSNQLGSPLRVGNMLQMFQQNDYNSGQSLKITDTFNLNEANSKILQFQKPKTNAQLSRVLNASTNIQPSQNGSGISNSHLIMLKKIESSIDSQYQNLNNRFQNDADESENRRSIQNKKPENESESLRNIHDQIKLLQNNENNIQKLKQLVQSQNQKLRRNSPNIQENVKKNKFSDDTIINEFKNIQEISPIRGMLSLAKPHTDLSKNDDFDSSQQVSNQSGLLRNRNKRRSTIIKEQKYLMPDPNELSVSEAQNTSKFIQSQNSRELYQINKINNNQNYNQQNNNNNKMKGIQKLHQDDASQTNLQAKLNFYEKDILQKLHEQYEEDELNDTNIFNFKHQNQKVPSLIKKNNRFSKTLNRGGISPIKEFRPLNQTKYSNDSKSKSKSSQSPRLQKKKSSGKKKAASISPYRHSNYVSQQKSLIHSFGILPELVSQQALNFKTVDKQPINQIINLDYQQDIQTSKFQFDHQQKEITDTIDEKEEFNHEESLLNQEELIDEPQQKSQMNNDQYQQIWKVLVQRDEDLKEREIQIQIKEKELIQLNSQLQTQLQLLHQQRDDLKMIETEMNQQKLKMLIKFDKIKYLEDFHNLQKFREGKSEKNSEYIRLYAEINDQDMFLTAEKVFINYSIKLQKERQNKKWALTGVQAMINHLLKKKNQTSINKLLYNFYKWKLQSAQKAIDLNLKKRKAQLSQALYQVEKREIDSLKNNVYSLQSDQSLQNTQRGNIFSFVGLENKMLSNSSANKEIVQRIQQFEIKEWEKESTFWRIVSKNKDYLMIKDFKNLNAQSIQLVAEKFMKDLKLYNRYREKTLLGLMFLHYRRRARLLLYFSFQKYKTQIYKQVIAEIFKKQDLALPGGTGPLLESLGATVTQKMSTDFFVMDQTASTEQVQYNQIVSAARHYQELAPPKKFYDQFILASQSRNRNEENATHTQSNDLSLEFLKAKRQSYHENYGIGMTIRNQVNIKNRMQSILLLKCLLNYKKDKTFAQTRLFSRWKSVTQNQVLRELTKENRKQKEDIERIKNSWSLAMNQLNKQKLEFENQLQQMAILIKEKLVLS